MFVYCCQQECDGINYSANIYCCALHVLATCTMLAAKKAVVELCMLSMLMGLTINATTYIASKNQPFL